MTLENEGLAEFWTEVGCVVVGVDMADVEDDGGVIHPGRELSSTSKWAFGMS